jgi:hypothetical protein
MDEVALLQAEARAECIGVHHRVQKNGHHVGYLSQETKCTPQIYVGLHSHLQKQVMIFKPGIVDEAYVQE